jgi:hypothetical protein
MTSRCSAIQQNAAIIAHVRLRRDPGAASLYTLADGVLPSALDALSGALT